MSKVHNILFFLFIVICLSGCRGNELRGNTDEHSYAIDLDKDFSKDVSLFDFCTDVELIALDDSPDAIMSEETISCKAFGDTSIFFLSDNDHLIREFDYDGNLLRIVDRHGRGPGEFAMVSDMQINKYTNTLDILNPQGMIYQYSLDSLVWKNTIDIDFSDKIMAVHYFRALSPDTYILYSGSESPQLYLYSTDSGIQNIEIDNVLPEWILETAFTGGGSPLYEFRNEVKYSVKLNGAIYNLVGSSMNLQYKWDMGEHQIDINQIEPDKDFFYYVDLHRKFSHKYASCFSRLAETSRYIIQNFSYKEGNYSWSSIVFDKTDQSIRVFRKMKEKVILLAGTAKDDCMYYVVDSENVNLLLNESLLKDEKSKEAYRQLSDDSNVVLIKYHLKQ